MGIFCYFSSQLLPVVVVLFVVNLIVKRNEMRITMGNMVENFTFELSAQIDILQPYKVRLLFYTFNDIVYLGNSRENRRYEQEVRMPSS